MLQHERAYIQNCVDHLDGTFVLLDISLSIFFAPNIFGVGRVKDDLQQIK